MGCCHAPGSTSDPRGRSVAGNRRAAPSAAENPVLVEVSAYERALSELKRLFEKATANGLGHASKADLIAIVEQAQGLVVLLKEAGMEEMLGFVNRLVGHEGAFVSWDEFQEYAKKAVKDEVEHEVQVMEEIVIADVEAGEEVLRQLRKFFESLVADEHGGVSKGELAISLRDADTLKSGSMGNLIRKASFSPLWRILEKLDTDKDGRVTLEEFEAHVRGTATDIGKKIEVVVEETMSGQVCWRCC